jgi:hypothetical protein
MTRHGVTPQDDDDLLKDLAIAGIMVIILTAIMGFLLWGAGLLP